MQRSPELAGLFEEVLERGALRVRATGGSMSPFIRAGEVVTVKKVPCSDLRCGDIILFKDRHGVPLLHRVVKRVRSCGELSFQTRGDALALLDEPVGEQDVMGKVIRVERAAEGGRAAHIDMASERWRWISRLVAFSSLAESRLYCSVLKPLGLSGRFRPALKSPVMRSVYRWVF